ncbi:MAG: hypothetical protein Q9219_005947 [cf. Caloplaca sp. 3 TL-2023]
MTSLPMMTSLPKTISSHCLTHLRRLAGISSSKPPIPTLTQTRGKKKSARQPRTVHVRLLEDIRGYGRKGSVIPISPGRMRNTYFPSRKAEYVTAAHMRTMNPKDILVERDHSFGTEAERAKKLAAGGQAAGNESVDVRMKLLTTKRTSELIEALVPPEIIFYRVPIINPEPGPQPQEPLGHSINAIGGEPIPTAPSPQPPITRIFGSVTSADIVDSMRAILAENEQGARVVLSPEEIRIVEETNEEKGIEQDRLKALGAYAVEVRLKGMEAIKRRVVIKAQEDEQRSDTDSVESTIE